MLVSILIPTHNRADLIGATLESCRGLRIPSNIDVELIVVANACHDKTSAIVNDVIGGTEEDWSFGWQTEESRQGC